MKQLVILFTFAYPYSPPTEQFLHKEIEAFVSRNDVDLHIVTVGRNVNIESKYDVIIRKGDKAILLKRKSKIIEIMLGSSKLITQFTELAKDIYYLLRKRENCDITRTIQQYIQANSLYKEFISQYDMKYAKEYDRVILYSYWLGTMSILACFLKKHFAKHLNCPVFAVSRAHGLGDLYFSNDNSFRPALKTLQSGLDAIFSISKNGCEVLKSQGFKQIQLSRLGVNRSNSLQYDNYNNCLIVSCSSIDDNKRVIDIAKSISFIEDRKIQWIHFGGGKREHELRQWCESNMPSNIEYKINGVTNHDEIMDFYSKYSPVLFINLSLVEGIPVSIMEAFSYRIPALATNVGATNELVKNGYNGYLVERDYCITDIVGIIKSHLSLDNGDIEKYRSNAEVTWAKEYQEKNFSLFVDSLLGVEE